MKKRICVYITVILAVLLCCMPVSAAGRFNLNKKSVTMYQKQTYKLNAKFTGKKKKVIWKSSNPSVATVQQNGKVTAKRKGSAVITATSGKTKRSCKVKVLNPSISLNKKTAVIYTNQNPQTITLKATVKGASRKAKWTTSSKSVATVSGGKVKAVKPGTAVIKVTANGKTASCKITVKKANKAMSVSMKNVLTLYSQKKYAEAQAMANKLPAQASDGYASQEAKKAYREKIETYDVKYMKKYQGVVAFYLTDINKDGTAELLIEYTDGSEAGRYVDIWSYINKNMVRCGTVYTGHSILCAYPDGNGVVQIYEHMGRESISLITMSGTSIKTSQTGVRDSGDYMSHIPNMLRNHVGAEGETYLDALY